MSDVIIIVVQTKEKAEALRSFLTLPNVIITFYGANICGFNYRGKRPNIAICDYDEDEGYEWTREVLIAGMSKDAKIIRKGITK